MVKNRAENMQLPALYNYFEGDLLSLHWTHWMWSDFKELQSDISAVGNKFLSCL